MEEHQNNQFLSKQERRELKHRKKQEERQTGESGRKIRRIATISAVVIVLGGIAGFIIWDIANRKPISAEDVLAKNGLHWHPKLELFIKGEERKIPANIGMGAVHNPIHTHDADNVIHLEFSGKVLKSDVEIGKFFQVWGKQFNASCILEFCNGEGGTVKMLVNGKENVEFEKYQMKDNDKIEIRYE